MSSFANFLNTLFHEGKAILRTPPEPLRSPDPKANELLRCTFDEYRRSIAGPPIAFDQQSAALAAALVWNACWFLVSRNEPEAELEKRLLLPGPPRSAAQHLSADLTLRFLAQVHRRAHAHNPADRLTTLLTELLRRWPLSGVLAEVTEGPLTPVLFDGHPGLLLLYAERLAQHEKPAWVPEGLGLECVELVWRELGKDPAALLHAARAAEPLPETGRGERLDD